MPFIKAILCNILLSKYRKQYQYTFYILLQVLSLVKKGVFIMNGVDSALLLRCCCVALTTVSLMYVLISDP